MRRLERTGYGAMFCDLFSDGQKIMKYAKNAEGKQKLHRELSFYKCVKTSCKEFPVPQLLEETDDSYTMIYYKEYAPLYKIFWNVTPQYQDDILHHIQTYLNELHMSSRKTISKQQYLESFLAEVYTKPIARYESIKEILKEYSFEKVNDVELDCFEDLLLWIKEGVVREIQEKQLCEVCLIHGDCQFNNILYNPTTKDLLFLDPRGYFGYVELLGPVEYDSAKILFALSGYDIFDTMEVSELESKGNTLILPILWKDHTIFKIKGLEMYLFLSIWLSNAHSFVFNPKKAIFSYYYALYIATLVKRSASDAIK